MKKTLKQFESTIDEVLQLEGRNNEVLLEPIHEGKWSIREIVGHMYYWDKYNLEQMVPKMAAGADLPPFPNHDKQNEKAISSLKEKSVESIIHSFVKTRKAIIESLLDIDYDVRFTIGGGKRKFSIESFIKIFIKHDAHHLKQINKKL
ncbi:DinB family protein [Bacillus shivajii]|uniref:DinB family protein n=1 Tax=Bacillus shivajii TaxID=1983719 RepID=UPI001CFA607A|nr:DinB family protein [Bacillus shivajii]UCZ55202.1 DinB family protein [Bacillus shivajii]